VLRFSLEPGTPVFAGFFRYPPKARRQPRFLLGLGSYFLGEVPRNTSKVINRLAKINSSAPTIEAQFGCGRMKLEKSGA
jgi:hypothetical protein